MPYWMEAWASTRRMGIGSQNATHFSRFGFQSFLYGDNGNVISNHQLLGSKAWHCPDPCITWIKRVGLRGGGIPIFIKIAHSGVKSLSQRNKLGFHPAYIKRFKLVLFSQNKMAWSIHAKKSHLGVSNFCPLQWMRTWEHGPFNENMPWKRKFLRQVVLEIFKFIILGH